MRIFSRPYIFILIFLIVAGMSSLYFTGCATTTVRAKKPLSAQGDSSSYPDYSQNSQSYENDMPDEGEEGLSGSKPHATAKDVASVMTDSMSDVLGFAVTNLKGAWGAAKQTLSKNSKGSS